MAACIRLTRCGMKNQRFFRVGVADERKPRDGKFIEVLGTYNPRKPDSKISIDKERLEYWVKNGARLSQTMSQLVK